MNVKKKLRKWYYYHLGVEKLPKIIRYILQRRRLSDERGIVLRNGNWVTKSSKNCHFTIVRNGRRKITSDKIACMNCDFSYMTMRKNLFLDVVSKKHVYTWNEILVITDPYNKSPLTALLLFYTPFVSKVRYTIVEHNAKNCFTLESSYCKEHKVAVFGLFPGKRNKVHLSLIDESGKVRQEKDIFIVMDELPEDMQNLIKVRKKSDISATPITMITGGHEIKTCAFDANGKIRFYLSKKVKAYGIFPTHHGRFLYTEKYVSIPSYLIPQGAQYYDMDYLGGSRRTYFTEKGIHHCARQLPNGNYLMGTSSFFGSVENAVVEISKDTGKPVKTLVLNDIFDEYYQNWKDWAHVNAVDYSEEDHSVIISMRNVHAVIKVDWETFELKWILSNPEFWKPTKMMDKLLQPAGDVKWFYQQHAACFLEDTMGEGSIRVLVYDNHWDKRRKAECFDGDEEYSYVSVFSIDEENRQVYMEDITQIPKSTIRSNAVLIEKYNRLLHMSGNLLQPINECKGLIDEVNYQNKEIINSYLVKPGFFAAYPVAPEADVLEQQELGKIYDYMAGDTLKPVRVAPVSAETLSAKEWTGYDMFQFNEDVFYAKAHDHDIKKMYFQSEQDTYMVDFAEAIEAKKELVDNVYSVPIWLKDLPEGNYSIYLDWQDKWYVAKDAFVIC